MNNQWYLRTQDETFGPESKARLLEWARLGRIQPGQEISDDGETWTPATEVPFLDMRWSIDIGDGRPRGPFNKMAAQALLSSGRLPPGSRLVEVRPPFAAPAVVQDEVRAPEGSAPSASQETAPVPTPPPPPPDETPALRKEIERLKEALKAAEARVREARREAKEAADAARSAEARMSAVMAKSATVESEKAQALKSLDEMTAAKAARETELAVERAEAQQALAASKANESKYEGRIQELSDELKRLPATARLAADAQAAVYALMKDEADDIAAGIEDETRELDELRRIHQARRERLQRREKELMEERQKTEAERQQHAAAQQALMARLSALEMGLPGATNQSREARSVRLAPWMGLKK